MKRIAILGCENSHAKTFLGYIKNDPAYADVRVDGVYSDDAVAAQKLHDDFGVPVLPSFDALAGNVDGVVITARHGDSHYKFAKPYLKYGVPLFVDKPVTIKEDEALALAREAKRAGVRLTGGSCLKFEKTVRALREKAKDAVGGFVRAPVSLKNAYGDFYFYAQHLIEAAMHIFGRYPRSVTALPCGDDKLTVTLRYNGFDVCCLFVEENYFYYAQVQTTDGQTGGELNVDDSCFAAEFAEFYRLLCGEKQELSYEDFISPVFVLNAVQRALISGKEEKVKEFSL